MYYVYLNITNNIRTWRETNLKQAQVQTRPEYSIKKLTHAQFWKKKKKNGTTIFASPESKEKEGNIGTNKTACISTKI